MKQIQESFDEVQSTSAAPPMMSASERPRVASIREQSRKNAISSADWASSEQIQTLARQLFFREELPSVRHVGFATVDASTETASLCLAIANLLASEDKYDVGLIDAQPESVGLHNALQISCPNRTEAPWLIEPRLWMVPRQSWLPDIDQGRITDQSLSRIRDLTADFDFSILWCPPVSRLTASIGQNCEGLVLVLTASRTRRLVALEIKDQLNKARVPLLGTVLAERRFPVPQGLYRSL